MKIEDQVCSLEQAKKLNKLGVLQGCSILFYDTRKRGRLQFNSNPVGGYKDADSCFSAFTISEFGLMIGKGTKAAEKHWQWLIDCVNSGLSGTVSYNTVALAGFVITQIENGDLSVEEINKRLASK